MPASTASTKPASQSSLIRAMLEQARGISADERTVQAAVCAAAVLATAGENAKPLQRLDEQLAPWERDAVRHATVLSTEYSVLSTNQTLRDVVPHLFERFLDRFERPTRKRHGVFFTPQPIADFIVQRADACLREEFALEDGLADESVLILDPACGTGVFPLAVIDYLHRTGPANSAAIRRGWNSLIDNLLPRLVGIEILPPAALLAKLNIVLKLAATGYDFRNAIPIQIIAGDALSPGIQSKTQNPKSKITVILGNPPFSSLSTSTNDWIARLVRGDDEVRGYIRANGQRLQERKTWLHDDYVKFIRLAQWHVEQAGCGIIGFVTNHGYLDNATFRLMRQELLRVFPHIDIVDLHGNRKKHEIAPSAETDENVFGLEQGVAISFFRRPPSSTVNGKSAPAHYTELWGSRQQKLTRISNLSDADRSSLQPQPPDFRLIPGRPAMQHREYDAAWSLADAMPVQTTAPVTARDHFVVAFTKEELQARIEQFRDLSIPDEQIRQRYFQRTRSVRYQPGDTRGWKLAEARRIIAADANWSDRIVRCLYRPFDWRYVFWHLAMIDWPRHEITRHLIENEQRDRGTEGQRDAGSKSLHHSVPPSLRLCLIARRQQLPTQPCTFFWISDGLALDGVIRSDNRGSESLFPLYVRAGDSYSANFMPNFLDHVQTATGLSWSSESGSDQTIGARDLLAYIYALFHSPTYRERYADNLRSDFPRILLVRNPELFRLLCGFGQQLIDLHLLQAPHSALRIPHFSPAIANFRAGGYVALRKWLQPNHRSTADPEYGRISAAICRTIEIMTAIDAAIEQCGGWQSVFGAAS